VNCRCLKPQPAKNPRKLHDCEKCGYHIPPEWLRIDAQVTEFFDRLAESQFPYGADGELVTPDWWDDFRSHCKLREWSGREKFGLDYLARDNPVEATEEATDGALYMLLDGLRAQREGWDEEKDVALTCAFHFAQAHRYARMMLAKRRGNTGPGMDE
jgi:hypothetical protein